MTTRVAFSVVVAVALLYALSISRSRQPRTDAAPAQPDTVEASPAVEPSLAGPSIPAGPRPQHPTQERRASIERVDAALDRLATRMRDDLEQVPAYADYLACKDRGSDARTCAEPLSDALYTAASRSLDPFAGDEAEGLSCEEEAARDRLRAMAESDTDPAGRYTALRLLSTVCVNPAHAGFPLSDSIYEALRERPGAEAQLLLEAHGRLPLQTEESRVAVANLARDPNAPVQVRLSALLALSHTPEDAVHLTELVRTHLHASADGTRPLFTPRAVSRALSGCGAHCSDLLREMAESESRGVREMALDALAVMVDARAREDLTAELGELAAR